MISLLALTYEGLDLKWTGVVVALCLLFLHLPGLLKPEAMQEGWKRFPRSRTMGVVLWGAAMLWAWLLVHGFDFGVWVYGGLDLGEFHTLRPVLRWVIPLAFVGGVFFMQEFLSVRALGTLLLLSACILLDAAWMKPQASRLVLVVVAFAFIIKGLFLVGLPYLMRDRLEWVMASVKRWRLMHLIGVAFDLALLVVAVLYW